MKNKEIKKILSNDELKIMEKNRKLHLLDQLTLGNKLKKGNTHWEQIMCTGYNPQFKRLEAVVNIKQATGYCGGLCTNGSNEFVRFFIDFKNGNGFQDMGYVSFKVADISDTPPGPQHPLSYMVYMFIDDSDYLRFLHCDKAVIPTLRAILSWNSIPDTNPNHEPFYGNHIDADIQLAQPRIISAKHFGDLLNIKEMPLFVDAKTKITLKGPGPILAKEILKSNKAKGVPDERTFFSAIGTKINSKVDFSKATGVFDIASLKEADVYISKMKEYFFGAGKKADVSFEELNCVGLNTATDTLGAIVHIKSSAGFNGNLCKHGSQEHVAFWADWNNNGTFQYQGTVSFTVHDISNIPAGGLFYNVLLPINVNDKLKKCSSPNLIKVRAVLSWESLPSTADPNQLNYWGNYKDALVQLRPSLGNNVINSVITLVGNADRTLIHSSHHLYNYSNTPNMYNNRPWGGSIAFNGIIDRGGFNGDILYRILFKKDGAPDTDYLPVSYSEAFALDDLTTPAPYYMDYQTNPEGWFIYKQKIPVYNIYNYLASWNTYGLDDGIYNIRFVHTDEFNSEIIADEFSLTICNKGMSISPTANIAIDDNYDMDLIIQGGDCHTYLSGAPDIVGQLKAHHPYFACWNLDLQPTSHTHNVVPDNNYGYYSVLGDEGPESKTWTLFTEKLDPCGYTICLSANTRVILNSSLNFPYYAPKAVGFCKK